MNLAESLELDFGELTSHVARLRQSATEGVKGLIANYEARSTAQLRRISELEHAIVELEREIAEHACEPVEEPDPSDPDRVATDIRVLVRGPDGLPAAQILSGQQLGRYYQPYKPGTYAPTRPQPNSGFADVRAIGSTELAVRMQRDGHPISGATTMHEQHLPFSPADDLGLTDVSFEIEVMFVDAPGAPWHPGWTGKIGGLFGFSDKDWSRWPGGGRGGGQNFSIRNTWNAYNGSPWRLGQYLYLGTNVTPLATGLDGKPLTINYSAGDGTTLEYKLPDFAPEPNRWIRIRNEARTGGRGIDGRPLRGELKTFLAFDDEPWRLHFHLIGVAWAGSGSNTFTRGYLSWMFGGESLDFAPDTPDRSAEIRFRNVRIGELAPATVA